MVGSVMLCRGGSSLCVVGGLTFAAATIAAAAEPLPVYSVERWCEFVARASGAKSEMIYGGCLNEEQKSYDQMKLRWSDLPAQTQHWCNQVAKSTGNGSYLILNGCVDEELKAARENAQRQFRR